MVSWRLPEASRPTLSEPLGWNNSTALAGDVADEVARLKQQNGGPILVAGSATLVRSLIENDLVDELRMMVFPVLRPPEPRYERFLSPFGVHGDGRRSS